MMIISDVWRNALLPGWFEDTSFTLLPVEIDLPTHESNNFSKLTQVERESKGFLQVLDWSHEEQYKYFYRRSWSANQKDGLQSGGDFW